MTLFSKSSYSNAHIKINYETRYIGRLSEKNIETYPGPFQQLVRSFQSLTNFRKNPNIGSMGVVHAPLESLFNVFAEVSTSWTTENKDALSVNNFAIYDRPSARSLI